MSRQPFSFVREKLRHSIAAAEIDHGNGHKDMSTGYTDRRQWLRMCDKRTMMMPMSTLSELNVKQDISTNLNLITNLCLVAAFFGSFVFLRSDAGRCHRKMIIIDWSLMPFCVEMAFFRFSAVSLVCRISTEKRDSIVKQLLMFSRRKIEWNIFLHWGFVLCCPSTQ